MKYFRPSDDSEEVKYLKECRDSLGCFLPTRRSKGDSVKIPSLALFERLLKNTGERQISTTQALVQAMTLLCKDKNIGQRIVPIVPDEARTFGMEALFTEFKIYNAQGQIYTPVDSELLLSYKESESGQILEEGISEAGAMSSFTAAGTAYSNVGKPTIPFYIYKSMYNICKY